MWRYWIKDLLALLAIVLTVLACIAWSSVLHAAEVAPDRPQTTEETKCLGMDALAYFLTLSEVPFKVYGPTVHVQSKSGLVIWEWDYDEQVYCRQLGVEA